MHKGDEKNHNNFEKAFLERKEKMVCVVKKMTSREALRTSEDSVSAETISLNARIPASKNGVG